jgi:hypothetical protein
LDLTLLVAGEDDRVLGRIEIQAHNVVELLDKSRVIGELERFDLVGLDEVPPVCGQV